MADDLSVRVHDLVKVFRGKREVRALDGVSFDVEAGTVLGLLGPNGAGKTTVVRILSTILTPDSGTATIAGLDVVRQAGAVRHLVGLAGQYATVDENLTGRENLHMVGRLTRLTRKAAAARAGELLEQFGLTDAANRGLKTYSGGMRRRLDLAAALIGRPPVLFLDEPTTGLDPQSRQDLWEVIGGLVEGGTTVLLTTQYLEEADRLAKDIVVIDHGRIIAQGTPADLKADLGTTVIAVTFPDQAMAQKAAGLLDHLDGSGKAPLVNGNMVEMTVEEGPRLAAEVMRTLDQHHVAVSGLDLREPSLDDVFLSLTGHRAEDEDSAADPEDEGAEDGRPRGRRRQSRKQEAAR